MEPAFALLALVVVLALIFDFINGFHDSANAIATVVSTRVLRPKTAVIYGAILNFAGAMLGTEVATTIGKGLVEKDSITITAVICTVIAAIIWNLPPPAGKYWQSPPGIASTPASLRQRN